MTEPRLTGTHHHAFDNIPALATDDASSGDVLTVDIPGETPIWAAPSGGPVTQDDAFIVAMAVAL